MGTQPVSPSRAVGQLLREKRKELGLTLEQVAARLSERGARIPPSTLAKIEKAGLDPGVRRLHHLLRLYRIPPHLVADLVELEEQAAPGPVEGDLQTLYREGTEAWKRGEIGKALAYVFELERRAAASDEDRLVKQKATLTFAVMARNLGKHRIAKQLVDDLLCAPPASELAVHALVLAASVWQSLGSDDMAFASVRQAATRVPPGDAAQAAFVAHQEARLLFVRRRHDEASSRLSDSLAFYREAGDTYGESRARLLEARILAAAGRSAEAIAAALAAARFAGEHGHARITLHADLERGRLLVDAQRVDDGIHALKEGLGRALLMSDPTAEFLAHHHLWKAYGAQGDDGRAALELQAAAYFADSLDDVSEEAEEVRRHTPR